MCTSVKTNVRICSVNGCKNLTHNHRLVCDEHLNLHVNPREYSREDQTVVVLNSKSTSAFARITELMHPRTYDKISKADFDNELHLAMDVISKNSCISKEQLYKYAAEYRHNIYERNYVNGRTYFGKTMKENWRN